MISGSVVGSGFKEITSRIENAFPVTPNSANCSLRLESAMVARVRLSSVDLPTIENFLVLVFMIQAFVFIIEMEKQLSHLHYTSCENEINRLIL